MLVGEALIKWWSGTIFMSPKSRAISERQALSLSLVFFQRSLWVLPCCSASLRGDRILPTPFILLSERWQWLRTTFTTWPALASKVPSSIWTVCQASSWVLTCWGGSTPLRPSTTSTWYQIKCSAYRGLQRSTSVRLGISFSTCWGLINGVIEVVDILPGLWRGMGGQLGASMSRLSLLHPRHSQSRHFTAACWDLEAPWG